MLLSYNIVVTGDYLNEITKLKKSATTRFEVKDLGISAKLPLGHRGGKDKEEYCLKKKVYFRPSRQNENIRI